MTRFVTLAVSGCIAMATLSSGSPTVASAFGPQAQATGGASDPAIYGHVSHLGWVVRDVDKTAAAWRTLGVADIRDGGVQEFPGIVYRGKTVTERVKKAFAHFTNGTIQWIQPLNDGTAYADFLAQHGEGVQHVAFSVPSDARMTEELAR